MHPSEATALMRRGVEPIMAFDRNTRRRLLAEAERARKTGQWGAWERVPFPRGSAGSGWAAEFEVASKNRVWCVLDRTLPDGTRHLAVSSFHGERPTWPEMQRIKSEIAGPGATAVEIYPPDDEVIDNAPMYHLWVVPDGLPFGLVERGGGAPGCAGKGEGVGGNG